MGSKSAIKVFKRKDIEQSIHHTSEPETVQSPEEASSEVKSERRAHREVVNTVSNWISERRERSRAEEIEAIRSLFGGTSPILSNAL